MGQNTIRLRGRVGREGSLPLQTGHVAIEIVLVPGNGTRFGVLPESVVTPPIRQFADAASIVCDPQRAVGSKRGAVASARSPPIGGGVDHGVATNAGMVGVGEVPDPANHRSSAQTITSGAVWVICPVKKRCSVDESRGVGSIRSVHSISRAPGRVIPSPLQPPPWEAKKLA